MPRKIPAQQSSRVAALVDKLRGYPRDADHRGYLCPPAPFGRTERYAEPVRDPSLPHPGEGQDNRPLVYVVGDDVAAAAASAPNLTPAERAELNALLAAAEPAMRRT